MDFEALIKKYENFQDLQTIFEEFKNDMIAVESFVSRQPFEEEDRGKRLCTRIRDYESNARTMHNDRNLFDIDNARAWVLERINMIKTIYEDLKTKEKIDKESDTYDVDLYKSLVDHCCTWLKGRDSKFQTTGNNKNCKVSYTDSGSPIKGYFSIMFLKTKIKFKDSSNTAREVLLYDDASQRIPRTTIEQEFLGMFYIFARDLKGDLENTIPPMNVSENSALHWEALDRLVTLVAQLNSLTA